MDKIYLLAINWQQVKNTNPHTDERRKALAINIVNDGEDIAKWAQLYTGDGWHVYTYTVKKDWRNVLDKTLMQE